MYFGTFIFPHEPREHLGGGLTGTILAASEPQVCPKTEGDGGNEGFYHVVIIGNQGGH